MSKRQVFRSFVLIFFASGMLVAQQSSLAAGPSVAISSQSALQQLQAADNPLLGSVPTGKVDPNPVQLTLLDAIDRGLKFNLGLILSSQGNQAARANQLRALSALLPSASAAAGESVHQISLRAFGLPVSAGQKYIVGPFGVFDVRGSLSQNILDFSALNNYRSSRADVTAAMFSYQNTRDLVVLVVGGSYLQALADASRVEAAQAEFNTAEALYKLAVDQKNAGVIAGIDVLRAQVQMQAQQQRVLVAQNEFDKQLLQLGRTIGLPNGQTFNLADKIPAPAPVEITFEQALQRAYDRRSDYKQAEALLKAAEYSKAAARAQRLPSVGFQGDYGAIGNTPGSIHGTFSAAAAVRVPIFEGRRIEGDIQATDALVQQRRSQYEDLRGRIDYEIRSAYLDYEAATKQLQVATQARDLARQQLAQSRDRFGSGVTNNIEVIQSQDAEATAEENYISSLFAHNFSKLALARALGVAEEATKRFLGGKQ